MKKLFVFLSLTLSVITLASCGDVNGNLVPWGVPDTKQQENNVNLEFDDEQIGDTSENSVTAPADTTAEPETIAPVDTSVPPETDNVPADTVPHAETTQPPVTAPVTQVPETTVPVTVPPQVTTPPTNKAPDYFTVKTKKLNYEDVNVLLFDAENLSEDNYTVGIIAKFYDENGKQLTAVTKKVEGFAAGEQRYILLEPETTFSSYSYTMITEDYNGECFTKYLDFKFINFQAGATPKHYDFSALTCVENTYRSDLYTTVKKIMLDSSGNIKLMKSTDYLMPPAYGETLDYEMMHLGLSDTPFPPDYGDGCGMIYIIDSISDQMSDELRDMLAQVVIDDGSQNN